MDTLKRFEEWAQRTYSPKVKKWKRPVLFILSIILFASCVAAAYTQISNEWTNNGIGLVIFIFGLISTAGLFTSIKGKDFWVALFFGGI